MSASSTIITPGTVSKILWHFTGGPTWDMNKNKQNTYPKPAKEAYQCMISIIESKELRTGNYSEVVKVRLKLRVKGTKKRRSKKKYIEKTRKVNSNKVCCLADIPLIHLGYHASRYGKFAIGFHRHSAIKNDFNPVLYSLENSKALKNIYRGFSGLKNIEIDDLVSASKVLRKTFDKIDVEDTEEMEDALSDLEYEIEYVEDYVKTAFENISHFLAFVKTFNESEFGSIYTEREWRATKPFSFNYQDIAMVVIPKKIGANKYYEKFLDNEISRIGIPKEIPVVPWEDLVEH